MWLRPDETTDDVDEYCLSVDDADDICEDLQLSAEPSDSKATAWTAVMF